MSDTAITSLSKAQQLLDNAKTPAESFAVEAMAKAAQAYHEERRDFENTVAAAHLYILARRKTTELIRPTIRQGQYGREGSGGDTFIKLVDYGFTKLQWNRRMKELQATPDDVDEYISECIEKGAIPTVWGMVRAQVNSDGKLDWEQHLDVMIGHARKIIADPATPLEYMRICRSFLEAVCP